MDDTASHYEDGPDLRSRDARRRAFPLKPGSFGEAELFAGLGRAVQYLSLWRLTESLRFDLKSFLPHQSQSVGMPASRNA